MEIGGEEGFPFYSYMLTTPLHTVSIFLSCCLENENGSATRSNTEICVVRARKPMEIFHATDFCVCEL